ncbi:MAG: SCO family protein [Alphaproteobacteria bacterium]|nr:SCO family protein [Rhodobiaceae bacterium]|tara:strand:+ start:130 stop:732 length:603 start_codon:yes stop_codon:yes gene_type:complete
MRKEVLFISFIIIFIFISIYSFINKDFFPNNLVQVIESQDSLPGGHFVLKDQNNQVFDSAASQKLMLIYFGFTYCPDVCPTTLIKVSDIIDRLKEDSKEINSIFITVDPERDTPEILSDYVSAFHEDIIGLTGTKNEIDKVAEDWGVYYQKEILDGEEDYTMNHLDIIFLANANGEFIDYFPPKIQSVLIVEKIRNIINR